MSETTWTSKGIWHNLSEHRIASLEGCCSTLLGGQLCLAFSLQHQCLCDRTGLRRHATLKFSPKSDFMQGRPLPPINQPVLPIKVMW